MLIEHDNKSISIRHQCELLEINRSSLYYEKAEATAQDLELMQFIDKQYMKTPFFGSRRMTETLKTAGYAVNRKLFGDSCERWV